VVLSGGNVDPQAIIDRAADPDGLLDGRGSASV
jgi:hypothetical protein